MKKLILLTSFLLFSVTCAFAQSGIKVPEAVNEAFHKQFPKAQNIHWGMENAHEYEADFVLSGTTMSANYSPKGKWVETETTIKPDQLPKTVRHALSEKFSGYEVHGASRVDATGGKTTYEVVISKNKKSREVAFNSMGKQLKGED